MVVGTKSSWPLLQCQICPTTPSFCDISHLLTHVGSKGHLSHQHKLEIRGQCDPAAQLLLEGFRKWYMLNGIQDLLAERLHRKIGKSALPGRQTGVAAVVNPTVATEAGRENFKHEQASTLTLFEVSDATGLDSTNYPALPTTIYRSAENYQAPEPKIHLWPTLKDEIAECLSPCHCLENPPFPSTLTGEQISQDIEIEDEFAILEENRSESQDTTSESASSYAQPLDFTRIPAVNANPVGHDSGPQLKGIYWPGMSLFDAATVEMKRKRNQKKDPTVVEQMRNDSKAIEAKESIFQADGSFLRTKQFTEEDTDEPTISASLNTTAKPRRLALGTKSTNLKAKVAKNTDCKKASKAVETVIFLRQPSHDVKSTIIKPRNRCTRRNPRSTLSHDEDAELRLTHDQAGAPRQRNLSVYRDDTNTICSSDRDDTGLDRATVGTPTQGLSQKGLLSSRSYALNLLNSGRPSTIVVQDDEILERRYPRQLESSPIYPIVGKENIEPIYTRDGRIEDNRCSRLGTCSQYHLGRNSSTVNQQTIPEWPSGYLGRHFYNQRRPDNAFEYSHSELDESIGQ